MGQVETTQREELRDWLGRLSYILRSSDHLHQKLGYVRKQYKQPDYWQPWKLAQFLANTIKYSGFALLLLFAVVLIPLFIADSKQSGAAKSLVNVAVLIILILLYYGVYKLTYFVTERVLVKKLSSEALERQERMRIRGKERLVLPMAVGHLVPFLLLWLMMAGASTNEPTVANETLMLAIWLFVNLLVGAVASVVTLLLHNHKVRTHNAAETADAEARNLHNQRVYDSEKELVDEINTLVGEFTDTYLGNFPAAYLRPGVVDYMWQLVTNYRASTLQEAINVYEADARQQQLADQQRAILDRQNQILAQQQYANTVLVTNMIMNH
ncbi:MAG: hypothetical protein KH147_03935 [Actinomyces graevenitzii]|uniref:Uncharacterized protein n=1 Tax=Actinomyces graevenitzii C83 TaxID=435830 RepID=G9PFB4_9ACTO|nr:hypothetical protein [Actinomyces graevenitzii]EHM88725.1 hypothetical protein HMPREF0045_00938 [Actinomyces graevenitzii C83]MBS6934352.1 hypothetical protein [Actinomyces graevenitzii]